MEIRNFKEKQKWNEKIACIEEVFTQAELAGFDALSQEQWRQHCDLHLLRILKHHFSTLLTTLLTTLPKVDVSLIVKADGVGLEPNLEEIRVLLFNTHVNSTLHDFLTIKGVSNLSHNPQFFQSILTKSGKRISKLYKELETILSTLQEELKQHQVNYTCIIRRQ